MVSIIDQKTESYHDSYVDSAYDLIRIPVNHLADIWGYARGFLEKGQSANPNNTMDQIVDGLLDQSIQLWLVLTKGERRVIKAAFLTSIESDKGQWVVSLYNLGGVEPRNWVMDCHAAMHDFARRNDCKRVRMCGRPAWQKILPGYAVVGKMQGHLIYERAVI